MKYSAHNLLKGTNGFLSKITPPETDIQFLKECRKKARNAIRAAFRTVANELIEDTTGRIQLSGVAVLSEGVGDSIRRLDSSQKRALKGLIPKFAPQGSSVYGTLNFPCHIPPQEMDMDDGVYLPLEELQDQPVISKRVFFNIVDEALEALAKDEGWKFEAKETCARLKVGNRFHLDFPLYAIPAERYAALAAKFVFEDFSAQTRDNRRMLPDGSVHLAVRSAPHWVKSDPLQVINWFQGATSSQGDILARICRYIKAWRDYHFQSGGPSSIALMACAEETMSDREFTDDSAALLACAQALAGQLERGVISPIDDSEPPLFPRGNITDDERQQILTAARNLGTNITNALVNAALPVDAIQHLRACFGSRFPNRPDDLTVLVSTPPASAVAAVYGAKEREVPQPIIKNRRSG